MQHEKNNEHKAPDAPGVFFTGETKSGFARWVVQSNYNSPINLETLELFCQWRQCGNAIKSLQILLDLHLANNIGLEVDPEDAGELAIFFRFLSNITANDNKRLQRTVDDLNEDIG